MKKTGRRSARDVAALAERVRKLHECGMTSVEVARAAGVTAPYVLKLLQKIGAAATDDLCAERRDRAAAIRACTLHLADLHAAYAVPAACIGSSMSARADMGR